ncbi:hypothetical protein D1159_10400 [Pseudoflavonifractor sp. 524-17]|uniref:tautomerase family protein n=1 Tax=Pseudoflavonifractor sp. 524-17 TaxID=2304577 RepID=UPI00137A579A|nr:tautomerase family protein [Pseudoflavonifractor sp. 524-17]NCE64985.1 hypothetical protein [Pseudoflavonifractor sp. 524-17]
MPVLTVSMRRGRTPEQKQTIVGCVRAALQEGLALEDDSYSIRLLEFAPEDFYLPPPKTEGYLLVEMDCFPGRDLRCKEGFSAILLEKLAQAGEDPNQVLSLIRELPLENWGYAEKKSALPRGLDWYYHTKHL